MPLADILVPRRSSSSAPPDWADYLLLAIFGVPPRAFSTGPTRRVPPAARPPRRRSVATAMAFDHDGDCGIYNVGTLEHARRRGLGTALTALQLHDAAGTRMPTASVQSTEMAERVYAAVGFRDLGRILEYVPS